MTKLTQSPMKSLTYKFNHSIAEPEDIKELIDNLLAEGELSSYLMDTHPSYLQAPGYPFTNLFNMQSFIKAIKLIGTLGWIEHTGDWDPYLIIKLDNDSQIETASGYYQITLTGTSLSIQDENQEGAIFFDDTHTLELNDIKSITLHM